MHVVGNSILNSVLGETFFPSVQQLETKTNMSVLKWIHVAFLNREILGGYSMKDAIMSLSKELYVKTKIIFESINPDLGIDNSLLNMVLTDVEWKI